MEGITRLVGIFALTLTLSTPASAQGSWRPVSAPWHPGSNSSDLRMTYDTLRNKCLLVRTFAASSWVDAWNGTNWQTVSNGANTPSFGSVMALAHDPIRDRLLVINNARTMWEWDGAAWHSLGQAPAGASSQPTARLDLCWHPTLQSIVTVMPNQGWPPAAGIWLWDGTSWSPGSGLPAGIVVDVSGFSLTHDPARDVLLAAGRTTSGPDTLEWDGVNWTTFTDHQSDGMRPVYAPSLGGIFGYRKDEQDSHLWDPVLGEWTRPNFGGTPGVHDKFGMAYDMARQRLVTFCPSTPPTWEYDPGYTYVPRTFVAAPWPDGFANAVDLAVDGDRIIVQGGNHNAARVEYGVQIDCVYGTRIHGIFTADFVGVQPLTMTNAKCETMDIGSSVDARIRNCTFDHQVRIVDDATVSFEDCTFWAPEEWWPFACEDNAVVTFDSCVLDGSNGYHDPWWHVDPSSAVAAVGDSSVTIINSTLTGGDGQHNVAGSPAAPALIVTGNATALVIGSSTLVAGVSPIGSNNTPAATGPVTASLDTNWNGIGAPTWIADQSWLDAPLEVAIAQTFDVTATMQPGDFTLVAFALDTGTPVNLFGSRIPLRLDLLTTQTLSVLSASTPALSVTIPNIPTLGGQSLFWQGLTISATDGRQLTNRRSTFVQ